MGYSALRDGKKRQAIDIFKLNTKDHPESWNAWASLSQAYIENGHTEQAIKNYKRPLELNPGNDNARETLKRITSMELAIRLAGLKLLKGLPFSNVTTSNQAPELERLIQQPETTCTTPLPRPKTTR